MVGEEEVERPLKERVSPVKTMGQLEARLVSSETSMAVPRVVWRSPFITWRPVPTSSSKTSPPKLKIEEMWNWVVVAEVVGELPVIVRLALMVEEAVEIKPVIVGVPVRAGETLPTRTPVPPVSSEIAPKIPADVVSPVKALAPLPSRIPVRVVAPVPPEDTPKADWTVSEPNCAAVENRLVEDAVVEKKLVEVAEVVVDLSIVAPPTTSNLAIEEVAVAPTITWFVVVETYIRPVPGSPALATNVQLISCPSPPPLESLPHENLPVVEL